MLSWLRSRTLVLACVFVLAALALRPFAPVERAVDLLFAPARFAREILRPLGWLSTREVRAALSAADDALPAEREAARALLTAQIEAALPDDPSLREGRAFLVAEVLERDAKDSDLLRVRFPRGAGVVPDMPVVFGDTYVGRVRDVDATRAGEGIVQLVTDQKLRVAAAARVPAADREPPPIGGASAPDAGTTTDAGAPTAPDATREADVGADAGRAPDAADDGLARFVVGGLVEARTRRPGVLYLGARHESRPIHSGAVVVHETDVGPRAERRAHADGFALGDLRVLSDRGRSVLAVETTFDYAHGLSAVAIVGGPELATAGPVFADDAYDDDGWVTARVALAGDSTPRRRTRHLVLPSDARVEAGSALGVGARFLGRVARVDGRRAIATLLGDPELAFSGVASIEGAPAPLHLGALRSIGVDGDAVLLAWTAREESAGAPPRAHGPARVATSSGDRGVPAGLWVGTCTIPAGAGTHVLRLVPTQDPADLLRVRVRLATSPVVEEDLP